MKNLMDKKLLVEFSRIISNKLAPIHDAQDENFSLEDDGYGDYVYIDVDSEGNIHNFDLMKKEIQRFFDDNSGKEFVQFQSPTFLFQSRVRYYHFLQEKIGKAGPFAIRACNKVLLGVQKGLGINRNTGIGNCRYCT